MLDDVMTTTPIPSIGRIIETHETAAEALPLLVPGLLGGGGGGSADVFVQEEERVLKRLGSRST